MRQYSPLAWFFLRVLLLYGLLIYPWSGFNAAYGSYFATLGNAFFCQKAGPQIVHLEPTDDHHGFTSLNAKITIANQNAVRSDARTTEFDTRSIGWIPTALTIALILSSSIPWRRRIVALLGGLILNPPSAKASTQGIQRLRFSIKLGSW